MPFVILAFDFCRVTNCAGNIFSHRKRQSRSVIRITKRRHFVSDRHRHFVNKLPIDSLASSRANPDRDPMQIMPGRNLTDRPYVITDISLWHESASYGRSFRSLQANPSCARASRDNGIRPDATREFSECLALDILAILQTTVMTSRPRRALPNWVRVREPKCIADVTNFTAFRQPPALIARFPIHRIAHP